MNSRPMILRFCSGSRTPLSLETKRDRASTVLSGTWKRCRKSSSTCSRSPARSSPLSTKMHCSRSPTARCTRIAATELSTPPESAQITLPSSAWRRMDHFRVKLDAVDRPRIVCRCGKRRVGASRDGFKMGRELLHPVSVVHPHPQTLAFLKRGQHAARLQNLDVGRPELPPGRAIHLSSQRLGQKLQPVANAEHRNAEIKDGGVAARRARVLHRGRAAGEDDSPRRERAYLRGGKVGRLNFTINSQLADPPGNELGVLAAEVEDQNLLGVDVHRLVRCSHSTR